MRENNFEAMPSVIIIYVKPQDMMTQRMKGYVKRAMLSKIGILNIQLAKKENKKALGRISSCSCESTDSDFRKCSGSFETGKVISNLLAEQAKVFEKVFCFGMNFCC